MFVSKAKPKWSARRQENDCSYLQNYWSRLSSFNGHVNEVNAIITKKNPHLLPIPSFYIYIITFTLQLNPQEALPLETFSTSRGPRCLPFPSASAFIFIAHRVQHSHLPAVYAHRYASNFRQTRAFEPSACQCVRKIPLRDSKLRHRPQQLRGLLLNHHS